ncbi:MAG: hypothetical protein ABIF77_10640 [bacterium]
MFLSKRNRCPVLWAILLITLLLVGCARTPLHTSHRVDQQHLAASVHFAVVSVAPWDEYIEALQPKFELTEADALQAVIPDTRGLEESVLNAFQVGATVASPATQTASTTEQTTSTSSLSEDPDSGDVTESRTDTYSSEQTSTPPAAYAEGGSELEIHQTEEPGRLSVLDQKPGMDPMMLYWAATALYQEVQLLNRYIKDAALRDGYKPYVVRLQISLMPKARNEPYDAYCTLGFFSSLVDKSPVATAMNKGTARTPLEQSGVDAADLHKSTRINRSPQIIPLMVTDNMEATLHSRMVQNIRQLAGASYFLGGGLGASTDIHKFVQDIETVLGRDLNSLLTVARVSDNTMLVRLGALQQATSNYAMAPRNHNVTLLLMVPEENAVGTQSIQVVSKTTLVDAETGIALPDRGPEDIAADFQALAVDHGLQDLDSVNFNRLLAHAQRNDLPGFVSELAAALPAGHQALEYAQVIWLDLVTLMIGSRYSATEFDLP